MVFSMIRVPSIFYFSTRQMDAYSPNSKEEVDLKKNKLKISSGESAKVSNTSIIWNMFIEI